MHDGTAPDDVHYIAGQLGCSVRKWNSIRKALIDAGKISVFNGVVSNFRADKELEITRKYRDKNAENGAAARKNKDLTQTTAPVRARVLKPETDNKKDNPPLIPPLTGGQSDVALEALNDQRSDRPESPNRNSEVRAAAEAVTPAPRPAGGAPDRPADRKSSVGGKRQFSADWWPSPAGQQFALDHGCPDISANVAACLDHHIAKGSVFADHNRAWQTWCRNARSFGWAGAANVRGAGNNHRGAPQSERGAYVDRLLASTLAVGDEWAETEPGKPYDA